MPRPAFAAAPLAVSLLRNTGYNMAASLAPVALSLITIPIYIRHMGDARYGVTVIFAAILGYFGVLDLGLSRAVAQRIAAIRDDDPERRSTIFWSAACVNASLGLAGGLLILPVAEWVFGQQIKVPPELRPELSSAAPWLAVAVPVALLTQVLRGAMQGAERFAALNLITTSSAFVSQLVTLAVALTVSVKLTVILPVMFASRLFNFVGMGWDIARHLLPDLRPRFDRRRALDLLSFGGWVALSGVVSPIMTAFDRFLIGSVVGAGAVSHYTVPFQLGERILIIPAAVSDALFPRVAGLGIDDARVLALRTMGILTAIMTPVMIVGIVALETFLSLWISPEFAALSAPAGRILLAGCCINSFAAPFFVQLQAGGRPRLVAMAHVIEVGPFLAVLYAGLHFWGLPGAATAFSLRVAADCFLLARFGGAFRPAVRMALVPAVLTGLALAAGPYCNLGSPGGLAAGALVAALAGLFGLRRLADCGLAPAQVLRSLRPSRSPA